MQRLIAPCAALAILALVWSGTTISGSKGKKKQETPKFDVTGRDPRAFLDAEAMLTRPHFELLDDSEASGLLDNIKTLATKEKRWSQGLLNMLDSLKARKLSPSLLQALRSAGQRFVIPNRTLVTESLATAKRAFAQGNADYEAGNLATAIESYREALRIHPAYWDALNNMALAEMHSDNDLAALFELSSLVSSNPRYVGGFVNFTVCLERLGQDGQACDVATSLASSYRTLPMVQYNMAWFQNSRAQYADADASLARSMAKVEDYPVGKWLQTINAMESGREITEADTSTLSPTDRSQGVPRITTGKVAVDMADAYVGDSVYARIPKGSRLVISGYREGRYAFYWPVGNIKHRLWIRKADLSTDSSDGHAVSEGPAAFLGKWKDASTGTIFTIKEINGEPRVISAVDNDDGEVLKILSSTWLEGSLSWEYSVPSTGYILNFSTTAKPAGDLECSYSNDHGVSGNRTLNRVN
jgi:tetratricopeptide (TPR) repeat protein